MTVLVLDSPELIARAAAMEAAQASKAEEVQAQDTRVAETRTEAATAGEPAGVSGNDGLCEPLHDPVYRPQQEESLALVI